MTSLATTMKRVDTALAAKYSGMKILTGNPPALTDVAVFIEDPMTEEFPELTYPSISIKFVSDSPNFEVSEGNEGEFEDVGYDSSIYPNERLMRLLPEPHRLMYTIETHHKAKVGESRDLVHEALMKKTPARGYITIKNIDDEDIDVWLFWAEGIGMTQNDVYEADVVIYSKMITVSLPVFIARADADDVTREKVAMIADWKVFSRRTILTPDGIVVIPGEETLDLEFQFDEDSEGPV